MTEARERVRRLFFAFWPDDATREALVHACRKAVRGSGGRPVHPANLHATVAFLGSVAERLLPALGEAAATLPGAPLELTLDRIAFWPKPQVLVAASSMPSNAASELAARLWLRLKPLGIDPDPRPYQPHVTLARKVRKPHADLSMKRVRWSVSELALVESVTDPAGARYQVLSRWPLGPGPGPGSPPEPPAAADFPPR